MAVPVVRLAPFLCFPHRTRTIGLASVRILSFCWTRQDDGGRGRTLIFPFWVRKRFRARLGRVRVNSVTMQKSDCFVAVTFLAFSLLVFYWVSLTFHFWRPLCEFRGVGTRKVGPWHGMESGSDCCGRFFFCVCPAYSHRKGKGGHSFASTAGLSSASLMAAFHRFCITIWVFHFQKEKIPCTFASPPPLSCCVKFNQAHALKKQPYAQICFT